VTAASTATTAEPIEMPIWLGVDSGGPAAAAPPPPPRTSSVAGRDAVNVVLLSPGDDSVDLDASQPTISVSLESAYESSHQTADHACSMLWTSGPLTKFQSCPWVHFV